MAAWVKFHEELTQGAKRQMTRATRFVFMELSLKCRPGRGSVDLRADVSVVESVCDLLGSVTRSERKEVALALATLMEGPDPILSVDTNTALGRRTLRIPSWEAWNSIDKSTERVRKFREEKRVSAPGETRFRNDAERVPVTVGNKTERAQGVAPETVGNAVRGEESRSEKITPHKPPLPGGAAPSAGETPAAVPSVARAPRPIPRFTRFGAEQVERAVANAEAERTATSAVTCTEGSD